MEVKEFLNLPSEYIYRLELMSGVDVPNLRGFMHLLIAFAGDLNMVALESEYRLGVTVITWDLKIPGTPTIPEGGRGPGRRHLHVMLDADMVARSNFGLEETHSPAIYIAVPEESDRYTRGVALALAEYLRGEFVNSQLCRMQQGQHSVPYTDPIL